MTTHYASTGLDTTVRTFVNNKYRMRKRNIDEVPQSRPKNSAQSGNYIQSAGFHNNIYLLVAELLSLLGDGVVDDLESVDVEVDAAGLATESFTDFVEEEEEPRESVL